MKWLVAWLLVLASASPASAVQLANPVDERASEQALGGAALIETEAQAIERDAAGYASLFAVPKEEAIRRLSAQELSIAATDRLRLLYRDRLVGISIQHQPDFRIVVRLAGAEPVTSSFISAGGHIIPVEFRVGAAATRERTLATLAAYRSYIAGVLPHPAGIGLDPRTGEIVIVMRTLDVTAAEIEALRMHLSQFIGIPFRFMFSGDEETDSAVSGGGRLMGRDPVSGRNAVCTAGFVVSDSTRYGILTAAHCPDELRHRQIGSDDLLLPFVGQWGVRNQDVQVNLLPAVAPAARFFADSDKERLRPVSAARGRESMRAGDFVCHRGERTGYSCAEIEMIDYAPAAPLCAGECDLSWIAVRGPTCGGGDSGGPVFIGTVALGIAKGANYTSSRKCNFYYFMALDFLPAGWRILQEQPTPGG